MRDKRLHKTSVEGTIGPIQFALTGPIQLVEQIVKLIRNIAEVYGKR
jgi:hypothetical protein